MPGPAHLAPCPAPRPARTAAEPTPLSIRKTLLLAFLFVGVTPCVLLALLAFDRASGVVQAEIEQGLAVQADALLSDATKLVYERLQNAGTWSRLEVMQDLRVGDVDKRLSAFLQRLAAGYGGLYHELSATDARGRVVASSEAARIGTESAPGAAWQVVPLGDSVIALQMPQPRGNGSAMQMTLRTPIGSAFDDAQLGELELHFNWTEIDRLLEQAARGGRRVALVDDTGRVLAGSAALLQHTPRGNTLLATGADGAARAAATDAAGPGAVGPGPVAGSAAALAAVPGGAMLVGVGRARDFAGFKGFGWRVLVLVPRDEALAPVRAMGWMFALLLGAVLLLTLLAAAGVSLGLARPIAALTAYSRNYRRGGQPPPPAPVRGGEVGELHRAFVQMVGDIERSQQQLARASALAAVGEMSAVIAHEVRTPLGIVLSSAQILQREPQLSAEGRELTQFIASETARLGRLVSTMLESSRPRAPAIVPAALHPLVEHTIGLLAAQTARQGVEITSRLQAASDQVDCDPEQMTQVLLNLILNGLQILPQGGRIEVSTREHEGDFVIDIADDGPGIEPQARQRIFESFYFQREGGIGLGLAVVQRIVLAHGGQVEAGVSALGGALFSVRLPRRQEGVA